MMTDLEFLAACRQGDIKDARKCLEEGADPNYKDDTGSTGLIEAARDGHLDITELLLDHNVEVNVQEDSGLYTAVMAAADFGHKDVVQLLIKKKADLSIKNANMETALMRASRNGHIEIVQMILKETNGNQINVQNKFNETALTRAAREGRKEVVGLLLDSGADVNIGSKGKEEGWSPLVWAYAMDHTDIFKMLGRKHCLYFSNILRFFLEFINSLLIFKIHISFLGREEN